MKSGSDASVWHQRPIFRSLAMAAGAAALYGTWAFYSNYAFGFESGLRAAGTQGFISFTTTFFITATMEGLHRAVSGPVLQFLAPAIGAICLTVAYTVLLHTVMGTPALLQTVLPVLSLGSLYCALYSANLTREHRAITRRAAETDQIPLAY